MANVDSSVALVHQSPAVGPKATHLPRRSEPKAPFVSFDRWAQDNLPKSVLTMAVRCASKCTEPDGARTISCNAETALCRAFDSVCNRGVAITCDGRIGYVGGVVGAAGCVDAFESGWCER